MALALMMITQATAADVERKRELVRYADVQIINALTQYIAAGGFVTIDVPVYATDVPSTTIIPVGPTGSIGTIPPSYIGQLNALGAAIAQIAIGAGSESTGGGSPSFAEGIVSRSPRSLIATGTPSVQDYSQMPY